MTAFEIAYKHMLENNKIAQQIVNKAKQHRKISTDKDKLWNK